MLVATDIAARGLDIDGIQTVIDDEVPDSPEMYVDRVGRTGRAGEAGQAITLVAPEEGTRSGPVKSPSAFIYNKYLRCLIPFAPPPPPAPAARSRPAGGRASRVAGRGPVQVVPVAPSPEDGPECCGHRDVLPMAGTTASIPKPGVPTAPSTSFAGRRRSATRTNTITKARTRARDLGQAFGLHERCCADQRPAQPCGSLLREFLGELNPLALRRELLIRPPVRPRVLRKSQLLERHGEIEMRVGVIRD